MNFMTVIIKVVVRSIQSTRQYSHFTSKIYQHQMLSQKVRFRLT